MFRTSMFAVLALGIAAGALRAQDGSWRTFDWKKAGVGVDLPGEPKSSQFQDGDLVVYGITVVRPNDVFGVRFLKFEEAIGLDEAALRRAIVRTRNDNFKKIKAELVEETPLTFGGKHPGLESVGKVGANLARYRNYIVDGRCFTVFYFGPADAVRGAEAERFFKSFKLAGNGEPSK